MNRSKNSYPNKNTPSTARLLYINTAKYDGTWLSSPHTHTNAEVFYVLSGQGSFLIGGRPHPVEKDDLVIINPRVQHTEVSDSSQPLEYIVVGVGGMELVIGDNEQRHFQIINFRDSDPMILAYLKDILQEMENKAPGYEAVCKGLLDVLLIRVTRQCHYNARMVPYTNKISKECSTVRKYIDEHFREKLTLEQLSDMVGINKYYLVHSFTRSYGISPINYLLSLRMQECRYLLQSTNFSMAEISDAVGFSSPCYFSQIFHKATGMSPREFRNAYRQSAE